MTTPAKSALDAARERLSEFESGARGPYSNIASDLRLALDALKEAESTVEAKRKEIERLNSGWQECLDALAIARNTLAAGADERDALRSTVQQRTEQRDALNAEVERLRAALKDIASVSAVEVHYGREMLGIRTNNGMALVSIEEATAAALRGEEASRG